MPLPFLWPYSLFFWPVYVWVWLPELRLLGRAPLTQPAPPEDRGSVRIVFLTVGLAITGAFILAFAVPHAAITSHRVLWFSVGMATFITGSVLRRHCFRVLGASFTPAVTALPGQHVLQTGAYRWVRHPSYSGAMLLLSGIGLALGNWLSFVLLLSTALVVYTYRAHVEERALIAAIGESYRVYVSTRKRFIPFIL